MMQEPLTASQARLQEDLRGLIYGDARCDDVIRQLYSSDGSPFEERPRAVVWPKTFPPSCNTRLKKGFPYIVAVRGQAVPPPPSVRESSSIFRVI